MSNTRVLIGPKRQGEMVTLDQFDFLSKIPNYPTETIATQSFAVSVWSGVDANPSAILSGTPTTVGTKVYQDVTAGITGTIYLITCTVTTTGGVKPQTLQLQGLLAVIPDGI